MQKVVPEQEHFACALFGVGIVWVRPLFERVLLLRKLVAAHAGIFLRTDDRAEPELRQYRAIFQALCGRQLECAEILPPGLFALAPMPIEQVRQQPFGAFGRVRLVRLWALSVSNDQGG